MPAPTDPTAALADILAAPRDDGRLESIVIRPAPGERTVLDEGILHEADGLVGDTWRERGSPTTQDGSADPLRQVTVINRRVLAAIEPDPARWPLAGDQLIVDLDLSVEALPAGTRLEIGDALVEVTEPPHTGCASFKWPLRHRRPGLGQHPAGQGREDARHARARRARRDRPDRRPHPSPLNL